MSNSVAPETPGRRRLERGTKGGETQQLNALRRSFDIIPSLEIHLTSWKMDRPRPMELVTCPPCWIESRQKRLPVHFREDARESVRLQSYCFSKGKGSLPPSLNFVINTFRYRFREIGSISEIRFPSRNRNRAESEGKISLVPVTLMEYKLFHWNFDRNWGREKIQE